MHELNERAVLTKMAQEMYDDGFLPAPAEPVYILRDLPSRRRLAAAEMAKLFERGAKISKMSATNNAKILAMVKRLKFTAPKQR
jgi:hypothetical protein